MKIAIYSRKSKYIIGSESIENQIQMCKDYAESKYNNTKLEFDIYEDEGFSGGNINRPKFQELIKNIKKYDVLICYRLDRISRNVADFSSTLDLLQANNCDFVSIREQFDTSSPMGRAMIYIASVFAQLERETIAERIRDNMMEMARRGSWTGGRTPLGYDSETSTYIDDEGHERKIVRLVKNEEQLKLVKLIYDTYLREGSLHKTEVWFIQHNIKSNAGILLEKTSLKVILQNPVYVKSTPEVLEFMKNDGWNVYGIADGIHSLLSYNKTESVTIKGKSTKRMKDKSEWIAAISSVEGVIDAETWIKVQEQFNNNKDTFPRLGKTNNAILTGKLKCALCGNNMRVVHGTASKKTGQQFYYYICSMKKKSKGELCNAKNLKAREIEETVLTEIEKIANHKNEFLNDLEKEQKQKLKDNNTEAKKLKLEKELKNNEKRIDNLMDELSDEEDHDMRDLLKEKIKSIKDKIKSLKSELLTINNTINTMKEDSINISFISSMLERCVKIRELPIEEQKQLINVFIDTINYDSNTDTVDIAFIGANSKKK
jgi:DNA invertase Pin-like site-specific DNA recombinase